MLSRILLIIFPIFAVVAAGYVYGRLRRPDMSFANRINMDLFLPALILHVLAGRSFHPESYGWLALGGLGVVLGSGLLVLPLVPLLGVRARTFVPPMMFTNTGNMGLPLAVFAFGERALPAMVVLFIVENTLHFTLGMYVMNRRTRLLEVLRIPMILASIAGLAISFAGWPIPAVLDEPIGMIGQAAIPLMLVSLGVRLTEIGLTDWRVGLAGAVLCPVSGVAAAALLLLVLPVSKEHAGLFLMFAALPPAVLNYIVAEAFGQEPPKVAAIVLLGNLMALVSMPAVLAFALA